MTLTISEFYGDGTALPVIHPDAETNYEIRIADLCARQNRKNADEPD